MKTRSLVVLISVSLLILAFGAAPTASAHDCGIRGGVKLLS